MGVGFGQTVGGQVGGFPGVQPALNNAVGAENYLATGGAENQALNLGHGLLNKANAAGGNILNQAQTYGNNLMSQKNPYLAAYANAADLPLIQNYQNAVAPNLLANFASNGTVGGSGQQQAFANAESGLAQGLASQNAQIYEPAFAQSQNLAAGLYGQGLGAEQSLTGLGLSNLGALQGQGLGLTQQAIGETPSLASGAYIPSQQLMQSGALGQNQAQNILNTGYQNLYNQATWPYQELNMLGQGLNQFPQGSGTSTSTTHGGGSMK